MATSPNLARVSNKLRNQLDGVREAIRDNDKQSAEMLARSFLDSAYAVMSGTNQHDLLLDVDDMIRELLVEVMPNCGKTKGNAQLISHDFDEVG